MRWATLLLLVAVPFAMGATPEVPYSAWSNTSLELRPDAYGNLVYGGFEHLQLDLALDPRVRVTMDGGLRLVPSPHDSPTFDIGRLSVAHNGRDHILTVGRFVRSDPRGRERVDGVSFDLDRGGLWYGSAWAGRLWHPETWKVGNTVVGGFQGHIRPPVGDGRYSRTTELIFGWEARGDQSFTQRLHVAATAWGPRGASAMAFAELRLAEGGPEWRATMHGYFPVGRTLDLGGDLRWEGTPPTSAPEAERFPIHWLAPEGYGVTSLMARWQSGSWATSARLGATLRPDDGEAVLGGVGRWGLRHSTRTRWVGGYALVAGFPNSWVAGGGAEGAWSGPIVVHGDVGAYRFQPLDGADDTIWEARVRGTLPVYHLGTSEMTRHFGVSLGLAAGYSRRLQPWVRGGISLRAGMTQGVLP